MNLLSEFQEKCIKELMDGMEKKNHDLESIVNDAIPPLGSGIFVRCFFSYDR